MKDKKDFTDELMENKAVQAGGAAFLAAGLAKLGLSTVGLGALATGKAGVILVTLGGPVGLAIGGALIVGGTIATIKSRKKK